MQRVFSLLNESTGSQKKMKLCNFLNQGKIKTKQQNHHFIQIDTLCDMDAYNRSLPFSRFVDPTSSAFFEERISWIPQFLGMPTTIHLDQMMLAFERAQQT